MKKILIVEDDEDISGTVHEFLISCGYDAEVAGNGAIALDVLQNTKRLPDLILLDYMMPELDGAGFRKVQAQDPKLSAIPILLMTADGHPELKRVETGARAYVRKPLDIDKFLIAIENCLTVVG